MMENWGMRNEILKNKEEFSWNLEMSYSCKFEEQDVLCTNRTEKTEWTNKEYVCKKLPPHQSP